MFDQPEDSCRLKSPCLGRHERLSEPLQQKGGVDKHQRGWCGWRWLSAWYLLEETESFPSWVYMQGTRRHSELYNDSTCFFHVVSESDWCLETKARPAWLHHVDHVHSPAVISHGQDHLSAVSPTHLNLSQLQHSFILDGFAHKSLYDPAWGLDPL